MSAADEFPIPPGDPAGLQAAGSSLTRVAGDVAGLGATARSERAGLAGAWKGAAGQAAGAETTSLATITEDRGRKVGAGAAAIGRYGGALETAVRDVEQIRRQAVAADNDARTEANRRGHNLPYDDKHAMYTSLRDQALQPLRQRYRAVLETLTREQQHAATALTGAVPEYRSGMSAAELALRVRDAAAARLVSVQQLDGEAAGADLTRRMAPYLDKGEDIPADLLAQAERFTGNPFFARSLLTGLGPARLNLLSRNSYQVDSTVGDYNKRSFQLFGRLLALGTRTRGAAALPNSFVDGYVATLHPDQDGAGDAAVVLKHLLYYGGTFGRDFLRKAGGPLFALDKAAGDVGLGSLATKRDRGVLTRDPIPRDVMEVYFRRLAEVSEAAQDFFRDPEKLDYYVLGRPLDAGDGDHGRTLGEALRAATTVHRNAQESGRVSAEIAANLLTRLGSEGHRTLVDRGRGGMLPGLADILVSYSDDTYYALSRQNQAVVDVADPSLPPGVRLGNPELGTPAYGIQVDAGALRQVFGQVDHDLASYRRVVQAHLDAANRYLESALAHVQGQPLERDKALVHYGSGFGRVMGTVFNTHLDVQGDIGGDKDLGRGKGYLGYVSFANAVGTVLPFVIQSTTLNAMVVKLGFGVANGIALPWAINGANRPEGRNSATDEAVRNVNGWYLLNQWAQVDRIQNGGGFAGTPADVHRWMAEHHVSPAARFVDAHGRILPQDKLTDAQLEAYKLWHIDREGRGVGRETAPFVDAIESQARVQQPSVH